MKYLSKSLGWCFLGILTFLGASCGFSAECASSFSWRSDDKAISLFDNEKLVLKFNYAFLSHDNVPSNEPRRCAGDYIYPLMGIGGENLTDNAPQDHYHHHGVFWTWPGVYVHNSDGSVKQYDLWTSNTSIRQRFNNLEQLEVTPSKAVIRISNGWYIDGRSTVQDELLDPSKRGFSISDNEQYYGEKIVDEIVQLSISQIEIVDGVKSRAIDFELTLTPTTRDISLQGAENKSYGGLTIRFRPRGEIGIDEFITTDEGVAKEDMPEKKLRWADYTSKFFESSSQNSEELSGASIFLAPDFPDYPPTWLTRYYGPLCVGFPGVDAQRFEAGKPVVMKARIWIHEGKVAPELLKKIYEDYSRSYLGF